jgi:hypothetical protein
MRDLLRFAALATTILALSVPLAQSAQSIRIVDRIGDETADFNVIENGDIGAGINLDVQTVALNPVEMNGVEYRQIQLPQTDHVTAGRIAEDGRPDLPVMTTYLAVPDRAGIDFTVEYSNFEVIDNVDIAPTQPAQPESGMNPVPFTIDQDAYSRDEFYPGDLADVEDPVIMRDLRMVQINMYPVQYNPVRKQLKVYRDLSVSVSFDGDNVINPKTHRRDFISDGFYPIYKAMVANFDQLFATTEVRRGGYLILTKDIFVDTLQAVAEWKHKKGYTVYIAPTSEIDPGGDNPTQYEVQDYIEQAYDTWEVPPEYVMIVGDEDNTTYSGITDYPYSGYPSDHPYSMVEGNDYLPDLFVSRLSVDNLSNLAVAMAKILTYESEPYMGDPDHWHRGLSVAGNVYATTPRLTVLWVRELLMEYGFTHVDTSFRWSSGQSDPYLLGYFNSGPCLVSYRGWAGSSGWYSPSFSVSNLNQISNNNKMGVMASIVCGTGDFGASYSDPCFGETWIRMGSLTSGLKGGPAFFGCTDHNTHTRWNNPIMAGYYWAIFSQDIYHFAAAAVMGKLQQYRTFPRYLSYEIRQYFHTYNMLGDPELEVRTKTPMEINVSHAPSLTLGINYIDAVVTDYRGEPLEGAYVTLVKGLRGEEEEVFEVMKTDASGYVSFSFDATTPGTMYLTVSGRDLYPYQGTVDITEGELAVGYDTYEIDDDNEGYSSGNSDGVANPGETIELNVGMKNFSPDQTAYGVGAVIQPVDDDVVTVLDGSRDFGDIGPDQTVSSESPFVIKIDSRAPDGDPVALKTTAVDDNEDSWNSMVELPVEAPKLIVSDVTFPGGNGRLDPGEVLDMVITLENTGSVDAENVTGVVSTSDDYTSIQFGDGSFGSIPVGGSADNALNPVVISSDSATFDGRVINLVLEAATSNGATFTIPFTTTVGNVVGTDPVGPDAYGYYMFDNTDTGYDQHPSYDWVEIAPNLGGQGTRISFSNYDDQARIVEMPFDFIYYGEPYTHITVCTNGFISCDTVSHDMAGNLWFNFFNWPIPDPGSGRGQISPFWDDLSYSGSTYGVYRWYDEENHRLIIEWYHMSHRNTYATETFELIITDPAYHPSLTGDSEIYYLYSSVTNNDSGENYCSVGFESFDELRGIEYTYDNSYSPGAATLTSGRAIKITTNTGRGAIGGSVNLSGSHTHDGVKVSSSTGQYRITPQSGDFWIKDVPPGTVDVSAEIRGYFPTTIEGVEVEANITTQLVETMLSGCPIPENLEASEGLQDRIELTWDAVDHADLVGYNVFRGKWENGDFEMLNDEFVLETSFTDMDVPDSDVYWYYVTAVFAGDYGDAESMASEHDSGSTEIITAVDDDLPSVPEDFFLSSNYPNPFNPSTTISYGLPADADVRVEIYNLLGQNVRTLVDEHQSAGYKAVIWDGRDNSGSSVSTGVYFYRIEAGKFQASRKMLLIK